ncbi:hypothetical protein C6I20_15575 [Aeromicrobium sp. A1-2]|uniref:DUF6049 family protein n=1 Tax=Aeromicrobium sp. A1-2 TaxID=2107713 RepID=UPI000E4A3146|nr:DUF6049 family protein [Aeromicrobium sp. A1-2]AXT86453.1 hypothetical protein C6I20_15575 [Aeromicrobium sp. A1-2]
MSSRRLPLLVVLLAMLPALLLVPAGPAQAADKNPDLKVSIQSLSPSRLAVGKKVTMTGTVTNRDDHAWVDMQAYLVIPTVPFTTRAQILAAIDNGNSYTGTRVVEPGTFDDMGDLAPGQTRSFTIKVPYDDLAVSGAEGVYPVGVQILATDTDGARSINALGRATTFLPLLTSTKAPVPTSIVWPFLMPDRRGKDGDYEDPAGLLKAIAPQGRLRNLLDLATSTSGNATTVLVDPALLVGVDDLANDRHVPAGVEITDQQRSEAELFEQDLLAFARARSTWIIDFDRPDLLALSQNSDLKAPLSEAIQRATDAALTKFQLSGRRVSWPTSQGVTSGLLSDLRGAGDSPVIVTREALSGWDRRQGSVVQYTTPNGPVPLFVDDELDADVPGLDSVTTLRQRILSEAALAALQRTIDPQSRADAITMVDPGWDPGPNWSEGKLSEAFSTPFTIAASLDSVLTRSLTSYQGSVPKSAKATPLDRSTLVAASDILAKGSALSSLVPQRDSVDDSLARDVAGILGVRWRKDPEEATSIANELARRAGSQLRKITIDGPQLVTLSSSKGGFPVTIRNDTDEEIRVGVSIDSSNPALRIPAVAPVDIGAGERRTLTVDIDLGHQSTTSLTARLVSADGEPIGTAAEFNVRSSHIGAVLWIAMALAGLFVLVALARRFTRHRTRNRGRIVSERPVDDDD